jgi:hypothetical protein
MIGASAEVYVIAVDAMLTCRERDQPHEVIGRPGAVA